MAKQSNAVGCLVLFVSVFLFAGLAAVIRSCNHEPETPAESIAREERERPEAERRQQEEIRKYQEIQARRQRDAK